MFIAHIKQKNKSTDLIGVLDVPTLKEAMEVLRLGIIKSKFKKEDIKDVYYCDSTKKEIYDLLEKI